jgi:general secretion pathway protein G
MSARCRRSDSARSRSRPRAAAGFTLVEILVVLVIAGLVATLAMPEFRRLVASVEHSGQRKAILTQLDGLGYRAFSTGRPLVLASLPDANAASPSAAPLEVPAGWRLQVERPIRYAFNGQCSGGRITLVSPDERSEAFHLKPPLCRLDPEG